MDLTTAYGHGWHRQPDPVERAGGRRPTNRQWVMVAAVWLLAMWSQEQAPGWASTLVPGRTKSRRDQQWPEPPPLPELADAADLPAVTSATVLTSLVSAGRGYQAARTDEEVAAELVTLISDVVPVRDQRTGALVRFLADRLAGRYTDVLRLTTDAGSRNGPGLPEPLHLLFRDASGSTLRVSLDPAPVARQPPVLASDGPDGPLRTRIACVTTLLSDLLLVDNNNPVDFRFRIGRLDHGDGDRMAEAARWWAQNREDADEHGAEEFRTISAADLRTALRNEAPMHLTELWDEETSFDEFPQSLAGHLATFLSDDLAGLILARMGDDAEITCAGYLPVTWPPADEYDYEQAIVLLAAGHEVAILEIDRTC